MQLSNEVQNFSSACERLIAKAMMDRPLTEDERRMVEYYCLEVLHKLVSENYLPPGK